ncbi:DUF421 domain-containing protein [Chitinophaga horti]|uniref:DUF421 domain-containing protein n=1 Tax=Chitinophaga horti TaxID=2920382 RepID=A0ABY6J9H0_9BACT|nr:DUF421 domain-containing protein [Chitinophaga horti]UYQ94949.1 DUF421 domain-containing protein [Chitinophaga horti]
MEWQEIFLKDFDGQAAVEILIRTLVMFAFVLLLLRASGKKGVRQLSIFEVAIIIALGSAAGDPMFHKDDAIVPSLVVFAVILGFYRLLTWLAAKYEKFESVLEGDPVVIIENGEIVLNNKGKSTFAKDEFFAEMRGKGIEHMGQVRLGILETNGTVSFFFFPDEEVLPGLPVLPPTHYEECAEVPRDGEYSCCYCGGTERLTAGKHTCKRCEQKRWVKSLTSKRIT